MTISKQTDYFGYKPDINRIQTGNKPATRYKPINTIQTGYIQYKLILSDTNRLFRYKLTISDNNDYIRTNRIKLYTNRPKSIKTGCKPDTNRLCSIQTDISLIIVL